MFNAFHLCDAPSLFHGSLLRIQFSSVNDYVFAMFMVRYFIYRYDETIKLCLDGESKRFFVACSGFAFSKLIFTFRVDYENIKNDEKS